MVHNVSCTSLCLRPLILIKKSTLHISTDHTELFSPGVSSGNWYFEIKIDEMINEAASRIGWSLELGEASSLEIRTNR